MLKTIFSATVLNIISKAFGFIFILVLTYNNHDSEILGFFILYWSYAIYFQSAILTPIVHYKAANSSHVNGQFDLLFFVFFAFLAFSVNELYQPSLILLAVFLLTFQSDLYLIKKERYLLIPSLNALKNIFALIAISMNADFYSIFLMYALGEFLKFTLVLFISSDVSVSFRLKWNWRCFSNKQLTLYITYLISTGAFLIILKSILLMLSPNAVVQLELVLRLVDVILIAITTGVIPIFLREYKKNNIGLIRNIILGSNVIVVVFVSMLSLIIFIAEKYSPWSVIPEFIYANLKSYCTLAIILSVILVNLSFFRKIFGFNIKVIQLGYMLFITLLFSSLLLLYAWLDLELVEPVLLVMTFYISGLLVEFLYIKKQVNKND